MRVGIDIWALRDHVGGVPDVVGCGQSGWSFDGFRP